MPKSGEHRVNTIDSFFRVRPSSKNLRDGESVSFLEDGKLIKQEKRNGVVYETKYSEQGKTETVSAGTTTTIIQGSSQSGDITSVTAGTGLTGGGNSGPITLNIDSTVATLTGTQTLTNKTLTAPTLTGTAQGANLTLTGDLTVSGTTITLNAENLQVKDKNIVLNYLDGDSSATSDGAGITIQDAVNSSTDATILWDKDPGEFDFSHRIAAPSFIGDVTGDVTGNADTATALATARSITMSGEVSSGAVNFDGTSGVVIPNTTIGSGVIVNGSIASDAAIATSKLASNTISGVALGSNLNALTVGTGMAFATGSNYTGATARQITLNLSAIDHDSLGNFEENEHIDWTTDQGAINIHAGNYTDTNQLTTFVIQDGDTTNVTIDQGKYVKFQALNNGGLDIDWASSLGAGSSGDPYDLQFKIDLSNMGFLVDTLESGDNLLVYNADEGTALASVSEIQSALNIPSASGTTDGVVTLNANGTLTGESGLTYDSSTLALTGDQTISGVLKHSSNGDNRLTLDDDSDSAQVNQVTLASVNNVNILIDGTNNGTGDFQIRSRPTTANDLDTADIIVDIDETTAIFDNITSQQFKIGGASRTTINESGLQVQSGSLGVGQNPPSVNGSAHISNLLRVGTNGEVALTVNDGGGNANVTFNHTSKVPDTDGNSGRIEVNVDSSGGQYMAFELAGNVTSGVSVATTEIARIDSTGLQSSLSGTAASPALRVNDSDTGLFRIADDKLGISTAGTFAVAVDASQNVGIGTSTPGALLDVNGTGYIRTAVFSDAFKPYSGTLATYGSSSSTDHYFVGNVGIGTNSPQSELNVKSDTNSLVQETLSLSPSTTNNSQGGLGVQSGGLISLIGNNRISMYTSDGERIRIDSSGNVGIGTQSPDYELDVAGDIGMNAVLYHNGDDNTYLKFDTDRVRMAAGGETLLDLYEDGTQDYVKLGDGGDVDINLNDDMFVSGASGNVGINQGNKLYFDGTNVDDLGQDTYIQSDTADNLRLVVGNRNMIEMIENETDPDQVVIGNGITDVDFIVEDDAGVAVLTVDSSTSKTTLHSLDVTNALTAGSFQLTTLQVANIQYTDGDAAITIANGGGVTLANGLTVDSGAVAFNGGLDMNENNISNVAHLGVDKIFGDADTDTQINFDGSDVMTFDTGNAEAMRIDTSRNVLIGRTSAFSSARVEIQNDATEQLTLNNVSTDGKMLSLYNSGSIVGGLGNDVTELVIYQGTTEAMRIDASQNVGIGTNSPLSKLHIEESTNDADALMIRQTAGGSGSVQGKVHIGMNHFNSTNPSVRITAEELDVADYRGNLAFSTRAGTSDVAPTEKMRITHDGKVGIGEVSPDRKLHITGSENELMCLESTDTNTDLIFADTGGSVRVRGASGNFDVYTGGTASSTSASGSTYAFRIESDGDFRLRTPEDKRVYIGDGNEFSIRHSSAGYNLFDSSHGHFYLRNTISNQNIYFGINDGGTTAYPMTIHGASQNIGIGTTSPAYKLDVVGAGRFSGHLRLADGQAYMAGGGEDVQLFHSNTYGGFLFNQTNHFYFDQVAADKDWIFRVDDSDGGGDYQEVMRIQGSTQRVGIGTNSPGGKLDVRGSASANNLILGASMHTVGGGHLSNYQTLLFKNTFNETGYAAIRHLANSHNDSASQLRFLTANTSGAMSNQMTIDDTGFVGIGTTSPSYKLDISSGDINLSQSQGIRINGNYRLYGDGNYTTLRKPDGTIALYIGGSDAANYYDHTRHRFRPSGGGSNYYMTVSTGGLGISRGSDDAEAKLHIGDADNSNNALASNVLGTTSGDSIDYIKLECDSTNANQLIFSSERVADGTSWTTTRERIYRRVDASNMGYIEFGSSFSDASDMISFGRVGTGKFMGIGGGTLGRVTIGPGQSDVFGMLTIAKDAHEEHLTLKTNYADTNTPRGAIKWRDAVNVTGAIHTEYDGTDVSMRFGSLYNAGYNTTTRMTLTGQGQLGIGTTSPADLLHIADTVSSNALVTMRAQNSAGYAEFGTLSTYARILQDGTQLYAANSGTSLWYVGGSTAMTLNTDGLKLEDALGVGVAASTTDGRGDFSNDVVAFSTSDKRLKENIKPLDSALDKVLKISGVEFDWKELTEEEKKTIHGNEGHDVGVIAQEIEEVLPEVVTERKSGYKAVKYEKIVPLLIQAIKEQQQQINKLEEKLNG